MTKELLKLSLDLKQSIENCDDVLMLNKLEQIMSDDEEVMKLAYKKDCLILEYTDLLKIYKEDSKLCLDKMKEISDIKSKLYTNKKVSDYLNQYKKVKDLYSFINSELFDFLSK